MAKGKKKDLLEELKGGSSTFTVTGEVKLGDKAFGGILDNKTKTWKYVNSRFGIKTGDGNVIYVQLLDGYSAKEAEPVLMRLNSDNEKVNIPFRHRLLKESIEQVRRQDLFRAALVQSEDEDEKGLEQKQFISGVDLESYLHENLADGMKITARGEIEYSVYNGDIQRNLNLKAVYLAEDYTNSDGEEVVRPTEATLRQTYIVDEDALSRKWKSELEEDGRTIISLYVPQYVSKIDGKEIKKTLPYKQAIVVKTSDKLTKDIAEKVVSRFFKVKKGVIREITLISNIIDGYEEVTGEIENTEEIEELIELGIMTKEEVEKQVTIRGNRVSEIVYKQPALRIDENGDRKLLINDDKYSPQALVVDIEEDDDDFEEEDPYGDPTEEIGTDDDMMDEFFS